ncbi:MAG TPA: MMPL family transporter [Gaiellaceae bacterium]|nr:MMPL family transporter [Gaiellaceae bacterium]
MRSPVTTIGRWSAAHPWRAIALWLAFVAGALAISVATGTKSLQNGAVGESARGYSMLEQHHVRGVPQWDYAYIHSDSLRTGDTAFRSAIGDVRKRMTRVLGTSVSLRVADGGHSALLTARATMEFSNLQSTLTAAARAHPQLTISGNGPGGGSASSDADLHRAEKLALPVTLVVLLIAFGSLVASLVPVLLGLTAVLAAFGLLGPISHAFALDSAVKVIVLLLGMAVGVDYALFYVVRSREERNRGLPSHEALERTARTSGHTVVVAGATVAIAMAGQYIVGTAIFNGVASGTIAVVACAVIGSVTVLPAVLELLGPRIDRGRIPFLPHLGAGNGESRFWSAVVDRVLRRPVVALFAATAVLVALALPALSMRIHEPDSDTLTPRSDSALVAQMQADFPNTSEAATLVVTSPPGEQARVQRALSRVESLAAGRGIAHPPFSTNSSPDGLTTAVALPLTGLGNNDASRNAVRELRGQLIPRTLARIPGVETAVTGTTAEDVDFTHQVKHGLPYVIAFVLVLAFILLLVTFRSIVVPLKAIVLNLLSVSAAYGVLVLVFQHHWAQGLLGFHSNGAIISWLPLFLFVVLFGLSMDYHVFILSRVREGVDSGMSNDEAVRYGIARTAGVVTSAALVMVGVFSIFGTLSQLDVKQAGVGLAAAILIDATIVRGVLLPASMKLLGDWNWYLPDWLEWLPPKPRKDAAPLGEAAPATTD